MKNINENFEIYKKDGFLNFEINTFNKNKTKHKTNILFLILAGLVIGFVNGFWGGGGGMICVPILISLIKLPEKVGHATTLLIMLPLSIASFIVYLIGGSISLSLALNVGIGFVIGGALGALLLKNMNNIILKIVFAVIIILGGVKLIF